MSDIDIRIEGRAGRITLKRPDALNALTYDMVRTIEAALDDWLTADIDLLLFDADGDRAFCSGGDIADMYTAGTTGDFAYGQQFWRDEYRMNAKLFEFPKPVVSFLQGFTMGGGVGVGCHGSHRIVGDTSQIAMPECGIGLIPDVGGSLMLGHAPGHIGEYLGTTAYRMGPGDAIFAGFADYYIPQEAWSALKDTLVKTGDYTEVDKAAHPAPSSPLADMQPLIDHFFDGNDLAGVIRDLKREDSEFTKDTLKRLSRNAPLAMECTMNVTRRLRSAQSIRQALDLEYRYTFRALEQGDFIEGIRAAIIDKDRAPNWRHASADEVAAIDISNMLRPLGKDALIWD